MQPSRCVGCREPGLVPVLPDVVDVTRDFWLVAPAERRELARIKALWDYLRRVTELNQDFLMGQSAEIQWAPWRWRGVSPTTHTIKKIAARAYQISAAASKD